MGHHFGGRSTPNLTVEWAPSPIKEGNWTRSFLTQTRCLKERFKTIRGADHGGLVRVPVAGSAMGQFLGNGGL